MLQLREFKEFERSAVGAHRTWRTL